MAKIKIMIVEDERVIAKGMKIILEGIGYEISSIEATGEDAIERCAQDRPDLILMDIMLKGKMNGIETAMEIRRRFGIPHIFSTAYSEGAILEKAKRTEPIGFLIKPFNEKELRAAIETGLYKHEMNNKLMIRERRLAESQRVAKLGSWEWDMATDKVTCSDEMYRIFGVRRDEFNTTLDAFMEMVHHDDREKIEKAVNGLMNGEDYFTLEARIRRPGGSEWVMEARGSLVRDNTGKSVLITGTTQDVTERKKVETELLRHREDLSELVKEKSGELEKSEKRYRELINYMSSGVTVCEAVDNGLDFVFTDFNRAGEKIEGINKGDLLGGKVTDVFPAVREFGLLDVMHRVWKTGNPELYPIHYYEDKRIAGWREHYVYKLPSGEIVTVYNDVTERVQTEEKLRESEEKYRTIFETAAHMITVVDRNGIIVDCNSRVEYFLGYGMVEIIGQSMAKIISPDYLDKANGSLLEIVEKGFLYNDEYKMVRKDGKLIDVRINSSALLNDSGKFVSTTCIIEDITERKLAKAEAVRASHLASLGELAAGVAHEVNNPVNGIINYAQILLNRHDLDSNDRDIADRIIKEGTRVSVIVNNLLSFARDRKSEKQLINIKEAVSSVLSLTETQLRKDGISLKIDIPNDLPLTIVQAQQVEQVFLNLISNARYALNQHSSDAGKSKVLEISAEKIEDEGESVIRIIFYDNGQGIPKDIRDKIMDPFFTTKPSGTGTGLGLSISHGIIQAHEGKIVTESIEGEYTKVIIDLPVRNYNK